MYTLSHTPVIYWHFMQPQFAFFCACVCQVRVTHPLLNKRIHCMQGIHVHDFHPVGMTKSSYKKEEKWKQRPGDRDRIMGIFPISGSYKETKRDHKGSVISTS